MSLYHEIPFLRNVVLTDLISDLPLLGNLIGETLLPTREVPTREVEWEVIRGGRNLAPIVAWDAQSPLVNLPGIQRKAAECVDLRVKFALREPDMLFLRQPGERESRQGRQLVAQALQMMKTQVETSKEKMRWDALLRGEIKTIDYTGIHQPPHGAGEIDGELLDVTIDFGIPSTQFVTLTAGARWNQTTATPIIDFNNTLKLVRETNGRTITTAYMNTNTQLLLDRMESLRADFRYVSGADTLVKAPHITDVIQNVRIVNYDEGFKQDLEWNGTFEYFLPDNKVLFAVGNLGGQFGDVANAPTVMADGSRVTGVAAEQWTSPDPTREYIRVVTVVMPRIFRPDWYVVLTVV